MDTSSHHRTSPLIAINFNMSQSFNLNISTPPEYQLHQSSPEIRSRQSPGQDTALAGSCHLVNPKQAEIKRRILRIFNYQLSDFMVSLEIELTRGKAAHPIVTRGQKLLSAAKLCYPRIYNIALWIRRLPPVSSYERLRFLVRTCLGLISDAAYELGLRELNEASGFLRQHVEASFARKLSTFVNGSMETSKSSGDRNSEPSLFSTFSRHTKYGKLPARRGLKLGWLSPSRNTLKNLVDPTMRIMEVYVAESEAHKQRVSAMPYLRHCFACVGLGVEMESHDITMQRHERLAAAAKAKR